MRATFTFMVAYGPALAYHVTGDYPGRRRYFNDRGRTGQALARRLVALFV